MPFIAASFVNDLIMRRPLFFKKAKSIFKIKINAYLCVPAKKNSGDNVEYIKRRNGN